MEKLLLSILEGPEFGELLKYFLFYLLALWIAFCVWVLADAYKRYNNILLALLMAILVLIFNFPALIFYLIIRPEEDFYLPTDGSSGGGIELPIVNFTNDKGEIELSLNLKMSPNTQTDSDMNVDVSWDEQTDKLTIKKIDKDNQTQKQESEELQKNNRVKQAITSITTRLRKRLNFSRDKAADNEKLLNQFRNKQAKDYSEDAKTTTEKKTVKNDNLGKGKNKKSKKNSKNKKATAKES